MKYFIFFISIVSIIIGLSFIILYFTDISNHSGDISYQEGYLFFSGTGFSIFLFSTFYLWKNNFFKRNN